MVLVKSEKVGWYEDLVPVCSCGGGVIMETKNGTSGSSMTEPIGPDCSHAPECSYLRYHKRCLPDCWVKKENEQPVDSLPEGLIKCPACDHVVPAARICLYCGAKLEAPV